MAQYEDLTGKRFGRLVCKTHFIRDHMSWWVCICDCGKEHITRANALKMGMCKSCGCMISELAKTGNNRRTHGLTHHPLYRVYHAMKDRCYRKNDPEYHNYGARGIKICEEWQDVEKFYRWAIKNGYKSGLSIDRIDVNGDYSPDNCRWATNVMQANNKRNNRLLTLNSETHTIREWADLLHIQYNSLRSRIQRGWTDEDALTKAKKQRKVD